MTKTAFITGITGQSGSFLVELLLEKGYIVHGLIRRSSSFNTERIDHVYCDPHHPDCSLFLHHGDLTDHGRVMSLILDINPDEIYNLGCQSHVRVSFDEPNYTVQTVFNGALGVFEAARRINKPVRVYQASSSEMFGKVLETPQSETTPFNPRSPYACAKVGAYYLGVNYREAYDLYISNGILYNHESERRGETFVSRKITRAATRIKLGLQDKLFLGNLDAKRDWSYAKDMVYGMWLMLQQDNPDDYILASGETRSVRDFLDKTFGLLQLNWYDYVEIDQRYFRPTEVNILLGNYSKAKKRLAWEPKTSFEELVRIMVDHDLKLAIREKDVRESV